MLSTIFNTARGVITSLAIIVYTVALCCMLFVLTLFKLLSPTAGIRSYFTRLSHRLVEVWISLNNLVIWLYRDVTRWDIDLPDGLSSRGSYVVGSNHQSWVDILALQKVFNRKLPVLTFFIKQELIWVPFLGAAWWALDFPFMKRPSRADIANNPKLKGKDLESARKACEKFQHLPVAMMSFLEGTRFSRDKAERSQSPFQNLLKPKVGGIGVVLYALGDKLQSLIDVTIVYPKEGEHDYTPTFWELLTGRVPRVVVQAREVAIPPHLLGRNFREDRTIRRELENWINQVWQEKDALVTQIKAS